MDDFERTEVTPEELCQAIDRSLDPLASHFVSALDGEEVDTESIAKDYLAWAAPVAILGRALIAELEPDSDEDLKEIPGLSEIVHGCPEFDTAFQELLEAPEDRELLILAASSWMEVRGGCDTLLDHFSL